MIQTFKEFIAESAFDRKITKGFSDPPLDIPGAKIVHHDPAAKLTVYHLQKPEACYKFGTSAKWCTNTPKREFAHKYLKAGNLFGIMKGTNRYQYHHIKKNHQVELRDENNHTPHHLDTTSIFKDKRVLGNMMSTKHKPYRGDWANDAVKNHKIMKSSEKDAIAHIHSMSSGDRMRTYAAIHWGVDDRHGFDLQPEHRAAAARFNSNDLHKFHADPDNHAFIATYGNLDQIAHHMKDHPDAHTRKIVANRIKLSGGEGNMIKPDYEHYHSDHPGQGGFDLTGGKMRLKTRKLTR